MRLHTPTLMQIALTLTEKERHEGGNVKMATKDDDYYLSCHHELNVVLCLPS